jgi:ABC-2 type transport system permease protein
MWSAMLPGGVAVTEIGDSWRSAETAAVLGLWAVVATALALVALREMSHRAAGSRPRAGERDRTAR